MEGGDWTQHDLPITLNIQTPDIRRLMRKLRCYAILFDEIVFSAGDYGQSDSLYEAAKTDKPLWGKGGPIRIALAKTVGDMATYRNKKYGGPGHDTWLGKPGDANKIIQKANINAKFDLVADVCKTQVVYFDEGRLTEDLRREVIRSAEDFGLTELANEMERDERPPRFNRDDIIDSMRRLRVVGAPKMLNDFMRYANVCYYFNGASALGAELGVHHSERHMHEVFARATMEGPTADLAQCQQLGAEWADHYGVVRRLVKNTFDALQLDLEQVLSLPPDPFHEIISSRNAAVVRQQLRDALPLQDAKQAYASREIPVRMDSVDAFRDTIRAVLDRERKWIEAVRKTDKVTSVATLGLAAAGGAGQAIGCFIPEPSWHAAVSSVAEVAVGSAFVIAPIRRLAVTALRNRMCPLLTFAESADRIVRQKAPS
jgi:hypothetical protein